MDDRVYGCFSVWEVNLKLYSISLDPFRKLSTNKAIDISPQTYNIN